MSSEQGGGGGGGGLTPILIGVRDVTYCFS